MVRRFLVLVAASLLAAGCSGSDHPPRAAAPSSVTSAPATTMEKPAELPPVPEEAEPAKPRPQEPEGCGTVSAAGGAQLQVILGDGATGCAEAERVVRAFHRKIAGQQPAGSRSPAKATVDGWECVSGPPSSQGGTSCSRGAETVSAAVVTAE